MIKPQVTIENFTIEGPDWLACRCGCKRFNMMPRFLIGYQAFRYVYDKGMNPTSGCRCKKHNKDVGGVDTSLHECETKAASAIDTTSANPEDLYNKAAKFAKDTGLFNEVIYYKSKKMVHLGYDPKKKTPYIAIV